VVPVPDEELARPSLDRPRGPGAIPDRPATLVVAFGFALSLGIATVAVPLLALASGYDAAAVGFLVAGAAASQLATRLALPWLLGRFTDRSLILVSVALMVGAFGLLSISSALPIFIAAQLGQGAARAIFWTASQTHVIRSGGSPVHRLVDFNLAGNGGTLIGPLIAGLLATSGVSLAITGAAIAAGLALLLSPALATYPPFDRRKSAGTAKLLRRDGVDVAVWATFAAGTWWSMLGSYVPVLAVQAGLGPTDVGLLVSLSEGSGAAMMLLLRWLSPRRIQPIVRAAPLIEMAALAGIAIAPAALPTYAGLVMVAGLAGGAVTVLAPALVTHVASEHEHGDAIALTGTSRAVALLGAPAAVGAMLSIVALPVALVTVAVATVAPGLALVRGR
jgi:MFS family permease